MTQRNHIQKIIHSANEKKCGVIIVGDIFNKAIVSEFLKSLFIEECKGSNYPVTVIPGNHDLPYHSMKNVQNSSIGVILAISKLEGLNITPIESYSDECSWQNFGEGVSNIGKEILFLHRLVFKSPKDLPPNVDAITASELLDEFPDYKWIFAGDCHKSFHYEKEGRHVVNPGHLNIQKVDELDPPLYYYIDTEKELVEEILVGDNPELIDDKYLTDEEEREERIGAFIEKIGTKGEISLSFIDNIERALLEKKDELGEDGIAMVNELLEDKR